MTLGYTHYSCVLCVQHIFGLKSFFRPPFDDLTTLRRQSPRCNFTYFFRLPAGSSIDSALLLVECNCPLRLVKVCVVPRFIRPLPILRGRVLCLPFRAFVV